MKRLAAVILTIAGVTIPAGGAFAAWTTSSAGGSGASAARRLTAGTTPTASASDSTVTVNFGQVTVGTTRLGAIDGGGYTVKRYNTSGVAQALNANCNVTIRGANPSLSCAETGVPEGTWSYKVTPILFGWKGAEGNAGAVIVDLPPSGLTVNTSVSNNKVLTLSGVAGTASGDVPTVSVVVCTTNNASCVPNDTFYSGTANVVNGTWTVTPSPQKVKNNTTYYVQVTQSDNTGHVATATTSFTV